MIRMLGQISMRVAVGTTRAEYNVGIAIFGNEMAAGADYPEPRSDTDISWMWYESGLLESVSSDDPFEKMYIDVKSRRRFPQADDELRLLFEATTSSVVFGLGLRVLYALP